MEYIAALNNYPEYSLDEKTVMIWFSFKFILWILPTETKTKIYFSVFSSAPSFL